MGNREQLAQFDSAADQIRRRLQEATCTVAIVTSGGVTTITSTITEPEQKESSEQ